MPLNPSARSLAFIATLCGLLGATQTAVAQTAIDTSPVPAAVKKSPLRAGWQHGVFMEIFVRAWRDSNGDGIGDLRGLTQSLPYLKDLGISGIWLMPITANADGDHGYATTHFRDIAPEYGTLADFDELIKQAHQRGMGVVMDYVINHSAATHPLFVEALKGPDNAYRNWFVWRDEAPTGWDIWGQNPWYHAASEPWFFKGEAKDRPVPPSDAKTFYFATFGPHMPDFNFRQPEVLAYHQSSLRFWLNRGLDGYRLDAVPHLVENSAVNWNDQPESRKITKQLQDLITTYPRRYVVCEATAEPQAYGDPAVCGGAFAFGHMHHYIGAAQGKVESVQKVADFYKTARPTMATFLSNHDIFAGQRVWDQLGGDLAQYKLAAAAYLLQPGTPFIYYGEEIGQAGVPGLLGDLPIRAPMSWTADGGFTGGTPFRPSAPNVATNNVATQRADPASLWHFYKTMIALRKRYPSIERGSYAHSFADGLVAGWQRQRGRERTWVLINYGMAPATASVPGVPAKARLQTVYPARQPGNSARRTQRDGSQQITLAPQSVQVLVLRR